MTAKPDSEDNRNRSYLPDFCNSATVLGTVLIAELAAIALTLGRMVAWEDFFRDLAKTSLLLIWTSLSAAATLCFLRDRINRLPAFQASALAFSTIIIVVIGVSEAVYWLGYHYDPMVTSPGSIPDLISWFPNRHIHFLTSNVGLGAIIAGLALRYFYISFEWHRNVEIEARTRIHALQARIRPHFLFNSMNTIAALTRTNPQAAESAVEDLADLFRASLADSKKMIRLEQEIEITRVYQRMEEQRLGERLRVDWRLEDVPMDAKIPSLTLQPLLENAIYHGVEPLEEAGTVEIHARRKKDMIYLSVRNILPANKSRSTSGNQIALDNIGERLSLAFGNRARLSRAVDQTHFQVSIAFPVTEQA